MTMTISSYQSVLVLGRLSLGVFSSPTEPGPSVRFPDEAGRARMTAVQYDYTEPRILKYLLKILIAKNINTLGFFY